MGAEVEKGVGMRPEFQLRRRIGDLAGRQHGVVSRAQLIRVGISRGMIKRLFRDGHLRPVHRGVYAVGHEHLTREGRWMAGVLSGGPGAVLSHEPAAIHWQLLTPFPSLPVITTAGKGRRRPGVTQHVSRLPPDEVTVRDRIPITTVARTLLDLAAVLDGHRLERALAEAEYRRYADSPSLPALIARYPGRRGLAALRAILGSGAPEMGITRSPLEDRFLRFLDERGLERPELNAPLRLGPRFVEVDCLWRRLRVAVELDGRAAHMREAQFESDRLRDRRLLATGWKPARVTSEQLDTDPNGLEADLRAIGVGGRLGA